MSVKPFMSRIRMVLFPHEISVLSVPARLQARPYLRLMMVEAGREQQTYQTRLPAAISIVSY
jgi:hypothetical protein